MPSGVYRITGSWPGAPVVLERFTCAAGPAGWRLTSSVRFASERFASERFAWERFDSDEPAVATHDLVLDGRGRQLRLEATAGAVVVRGGLTERGLEWSRDGVAHVDGAAVGFTGASPAFLVATVRLLGLAQGVRRRVSLVSLAASTLAATSVEQGWTLVSVDSHDTDLGPLLVSAYDVADLATGVVSRVHVAGDVVLDAPGVELIELLGPPTR